VVVSVLRVHLKPGLDRVAAGLAVGALSLPLRRRQVLQELGSGPTCGVKGLKRGPEGAVVVQPAGVFLFVVSNDLGPLLRKQTAQSDGPGHLSVRQVMDDLPGRPFAGRRADVKPLCAKAFKRSHLWETKSWSDTSCLPSMARVIWEQVSRVKPLDMTAEEYEQDSAKRLKETLY